MSSFAHVPWDSPSQASHQNVIAQLNYKAMDSLVIFTAKQFNSLGVYGWGLLILAVVVTILKLLYIHIVPLITVFLEQLTSASQTRMTSVHTTVPVFSVEIANQDIVKYLELHDALSVPIPISHCFQCSLQLGQLQFLYLANATSTFPKEL